MRFATEVFGWEAPPIPKETDIVGEMVFRLHCFADWMAHQQDRPFYVDSDMSVYVVKPRAVADRLQQIYFGKE